MQARWRRVVVDVAPDVAELAADALWSSGAAGIEEQPADGRVRLLAGFADPVVAEAAADELRSRGLAARPTVEAVVDDGLDGWRAHARAERAGGFWLVPAWQEPPTGARPSEVVRLDPGRTFGSGSHPTTRLVVALLEELVAPGDRVLDVGTGSGVLAVVAARLGAGEVTAIDVDPESPAAVGANAAANGVADRVRASGRPLADVVAAEPAFDVVAANLLAPIVGELAADLVAATAPQGRVVVSGLLADRWEQGVAPLAPLAVQAVAIDEGWAAVVLAHPTAPPR